jgi:hypothetical protein
VKRLAGIVGYLAVARPGLLLSSSAFSWRGRMRQLHDGVHRRAFDSSK